MAHILPSDLVTLREFAALQCVPLVTVRTWKTRYCNAKWPQDFPAPWRPGAQGDPDLYLLKNLDSWLNRTGRQIRTT